MKNRQGYKLTDVETVRILLRKESVLRSVNHTDEILLMLGRNVVSVVATIVGDRSYTWFV